MSIQFFSFPSNGWQLNASPTGHFRICRMCGRLA